MPSLKIYKTHPGVTLPKFQTKQSACFDLAYHPHGKSTIKGVKNNNSPFERDINMQNGIIVIGGHERAMIPTGMIFDIPLGYSMRLHPRSGLSYTSGVMLANCEGVIDSDYVEEIFLLIYNTTDANFTISPGDRLAQAELVPHEPCTILETLNRPAIKTDRVGGMGSTGVITADVGDLSKEQVTRSVKKTQRKLDKAS
jgi:dUTP pyrophosphatase